MSPMKMKDHSELVNKLKGCSNIQEKLSVLLSSGMSRRSAHWLVRQLLAIDVERHRQQIQSHREEDMGWQRTTLMMPDASTLTISHDPMGENNLQQVIIRVPPFLKVDGVADKDKKVIMRYSATGQQLPMDPTSAKVYAAFSEMNEVMRCEDEISALLLLMGYGHSVASAKALFQQILTFDYSSWKARNKREDEARVKREEKNQSKEIAAARHIVVETSDTEEEEEREQETRETDTSGDEVDSKEERREIVEENEPVFKFEVDRDLWHPVSPPLHAHRRF